MTNQIFEINSALISPDNTWMLWAVCILGASIAILAEQRFRWAAKVSGTLIALFIAMILSTLRIIPSESSVWDAVWDYIVPLCIPMILIKCDIRCLGRDSGRVISVFLTGALGTAIGAIAGYFILRNSITELGSLAGVFTGTYIGGGCNFTDICKALEIRQELVSTATTADNALMAMYFIVLTWIPSIKFFRKHFTHPLVDDAEADTDAAMKDNSGRIFIPAYSSGDPISIKDIAVTISTSIVIVSISHWLAAICSALIPDTGILAAIIEMLLGNIYVWICGLSIVCATLGSNYFRKINGTNEIGAFIIYILFFAIGVQVSLPLLFNRAAILLLYALIVIVFNMVFCFATGKVLGCTLEEIIIASNANIGGPTTAAAMAGAKGWNRLAGPAVIVGVIGYALGSYLGLVVSGLLVG